MKQICLILDTPEIRLFELFTLSLVGRGVNFGALSMADNLWQAIGHGKQGRTQTRSQETEEEET